MGSRGLKQAEAVAAHFQRAAEIDSHGVFQMDGIGDRRGLIAAVHGQLGQADVDGGHGDLGDGDAAQGAAPGDIRPVIIALHRDAGPCADLAEQGGAQTVGTVFHVGVELHHNAAAHHRSVAGVRQLRVGGVQGMGVVRADQKALGQQPGKGQVQSLTDAAEGVAEQGGAGPLGGAGAYLFAVKGAEHGDGTAGPGAEEALQAAPHALQVVQRGGGEPGLVQPPHRGLLADIQVQVVAQNPAPGGLLQQRPEFALCVGAPQQGQHIGDGIPLEALVDLAVHVNGHIGNQQQIPVNVNQPAFRALLRLHHHPSGDGQRTVQPGGKDLPAVALHGNPGIGAGELSVFLYLEAGTVRVGGAHQKACGSLPGDAEGQHRGTAPGDEVFPAGKQLPVFRLRQMGIARVGEHPGHIGLGVVHTVGGVQKIAERLNSMVHFFFSFPKQSAAKRKCGLFALFYTGSRGLVNCRAIAGKRSKTGE